MSKTQRNDPCPCGSGNKYKKCCAKSNVVTFPTHIVEDELKIIHQELFDFAVQHYDEEIKDFMEDSLYKMSDIEDLDSLLTLFSTIWAIFNESLSKDGLTIFDDFLQLKGSNIKRTQTRDIVVQWSKLKPAVFRVIKENPNSIDLENIASGEVSSFFFDLEEDFTTDQLIIAFPYKINQEKHDVFMMPFIVPHELSYEITELIHENIEKTREVFDETYSLKQYIEEDFTEFLLDTFVYPVTEDDDFDDRDINEHEWNDPRHELVADLFTKHMQNEYHEEVVEMAQMIWFIYCEKTHPQPKKLGVYAGAIEYLINGMLSIHNHTQKTMAEKYEVSSSTLSTRVRDIRAVVSREIENFEQILTFTKMKQPEIFELQNSKIDLEKKLAQFENISSNREFNSLEDLNQFLESPVAIEDESDEQLAQNLIYKAMETKGKKRKKLINDALKLDDQSIDAYVLLGNDSHSVKKALSYYEKAIKLGEEKFRDTYDEDKGHFWGMVSTRPFMRAKEAYATALKASGLLSDAISHFEQMIELNPNDNQGIRFILCDTYLENDNIKKAEQLLKNYEEDNATHFQYNRIIVEYVKNGYTLRLDEIITKALAENSHVPDYLLERKIISGNIPNQYRLGDETEAQIYVLATQHIWEMHKPLLAMLREWTR